MPKSSLQQQRRRDFLRACVRAKSELATQQGKLSALAVARRAINTPAPGYYIEHEYARKVLYTYYSRGTLPASTDQRRAMWLELIDRVDHLREQGWNVTDALSRVLAIGEASRFFIAESTAMRELRTHHRHP